MVAERNGATSRRRVLIIGACDSDDMRPVRAAVDESCGRADVRRVGSVEDALALAADRWPADVVVVCQHWPREYSSRDVDRLMAALPLARLICCYGPWCASDGRSGTPWPLAVRVPAHAAAARLRRELDVVDGRRPPLPLTASRDEIFLFDLDDPARRV